MMKILRTIFPALLLLTFLSGSALAQTKIATVDLKKLFDNYYKTKLAQASIQESVNQFVKDENGMKDDLKKGTDDYQNLVAQANDQALSADERNHRKQAADDKMKQLQAFKANIDQLDRQANVTVGEKRERMHDSILIDIKAAVATKAKSAGYTLVLDATSDTANGILTVVYNNGENDLTDAVLAQLNLGAPIDVTRPATTLSNPFMTNSPGKP